MQHLIFHADMKLENVLHPPEMHPPLADSLTYWYYLYYLPSHLQSLHLFWASNTDANHYWCRKSRTSTCIIWDGWVKLMMLLWSKFHGKNMGRSSTYHFIINFLSTSNYYRWQSVTCLIFLTNTCTNSDACTRLWYVKGLGADYACVLACI